MKIMALAIIAFGLVTPVGDRGYSSGGGRIYSRDGKNLGEIRQDRTGGGYSVYDKESKRIMDGKPSPDGKAIQFYSPDGKRLFEIRKDR